jgi:hypothetical protein
MMLLEDCCSHGSSAGTCTHQHHGSSAGICTHQHHGSSAGTCTHQHPSKKQTARKTRNKEKKEKTNAKKNKERDSLHKVAKDAVYTQCCGKNCLATLAGESEGINASIEVLKVKFNTVMTK